MCIGCLGLGGQKGAALCLSPCASSLCPLSQPKARALRLAGLFSVWNWLPERSDKQEME